MPRVTGGKARPCRVGLDAHLLSLTQTYRAAGINGYIYELLNRLPAHAPGDPSLELIAFLREPAFARLPVSGSSAAPGTRAAPGGVSPGNSPSWQRAPGN